MVLSSVKVMLALAVFPAGSRSVTTTARSASPVSAGARCGAGKGPVRVVVAAGGAAGVAAQRIRRGRNGFVEREGDVGMGGVAFFFDGGPDNGVLPSFPGGGFSDLRSPAVNGVGPRH